MRAVAGPPGATTAEKGAPAALMSAWVALKLGSAVRVAPEKTSATEGSSCSGASPW